jgi:elongation factor 3
LAVVLDFTASLVADITYSKRFADKSVWYRCVGVYIAPWLPNQKDDSAAFAESICKHFYAIEKVLFFFFFQVIDLQLIIAFTGQARSPS